ncbi:hypothetical protein ABT336_00150 [Micromonospora sp. NPDC000207]|uniref:hypothetical protein n=1 Tax=Micromonospora sp. NPDC000207 TaxID=3154246 RepID=UPI0033214838
MHMTIAAAEASRGWGGPAALGIALAAFLIVMGIVEHRKASGALSPNEGDTPGVRVNRQVSEVSDTDDTEPDTGWWGRIATVGGRRVRVVDEDLDNDVDEDDEPLTIEETIEELLDRDVPYARIVEQVMDEHEVSESTAKRRIRDTRAARIAQA